MFTKLVTVPDLSLIIDKSDLDLTPPTDNRPFFFQLIKLKAMFNPKFWEQDSYFNIHSHAVIIIGLLLITVAFLTLLCIFIPMMMARESLAGSASLLVYFSCIG